MRISVFGDNVNFDFPSQMRVNLEADKDEMLGRTCFDDNCKKYFKVNITNLSNHVGDSYCPYCGAFEDSQAFSTQEQIEYAKSVAFRQFLGQFGNELKKWK